MKRLKIAILDGFTCVRDDLDWSAIEALADVSAYDRTPSECIVERALGADVVLTNKVPMFEPQLRALPGLKYIGVLATGYNNVDLALAKKLGILVSNVPEYGSDSVAQAAFAHILNISNAVGRHSEAVAAGAWGKCPDVCFCLTRQVELAGKVMGIIGYGAIGSKVARIAAAFGMRVKAYSPSRKPGSSDSVVEFVGMDEIFGQSDIISLNCLLNDATKDIICSRNISKMKRGVWIINTGRGGLVNEADLAAALLSGQVGAAGIDVLCKEPPAGGNVLIGLPNCFITPHNAWTSREARSRLINTVAENISSWISGSPKNIVNF